VTDDSFGSDNVTVNGQTRVPITVKQCTVETTTTTETTTDTTTTTTEQNLAGISFVAFCQDGGTQQGKESQQSL